MEQIMSTVNRLSVYLYALALVAIASLLTAAPASAQADPGGLGAGAKEAATSGVTYGAAVALVIIAAVIVYRLVKRFSS